MIATSKNNYKDNSFFFLLWGWLVLAASLLHFALLYVTGAREYAWIPWPVLMSAGAVISVIAGYRMGKKSNVMSHVDKMLIYLWYGFFSVFTIILFMAIFGKLSWMMMHPLIIALYGLGTFVTGGVLKFRLLIIGGVAAWIIAFAAFFVSSQYILLLTALSIVIAYLIPGYMLKAKA
jgi:hypothetical protein